MAIKAMDLITLVINKDGSVVLNVDFDKVGNIATLTAHVYQNVNEITSLFYDGLFAWYCRSEDTGTNAVLLGYGKSISYDVSNIEYGGSTIICEFADTAKWIGLTTYDGSPLCVYSGEQIETLEV